MEVVDKYSFWRELGFYSQRTHW